jgi:hypothetical protein
MSKKTPIAGVRTQSVDKNFGKLRVSGCGICGSCWGNRCKQAHYARSNGLPRKKPLLFSSRWKTHRKSMARGSGRDNLERQLDDSELRCLPHKKTGYSVAKPGTDLWLSEVRQENAFTQRAVYVASQTNCPHCELREQCLGRGAKGNRARRVSAVRRLLPSSSSVEHNPHFLGAIRWVDVAGRALRRTWMKHWRTQYVEIISLSPAPLSVPLLLVLLVPCVHITVGAGLIDSHATPGGDHHACVSLLQAFCCSYSQLTQEELTLKKPLL